MIFFKKKPTHPTSNPWLGNENHIILEKKFFELNYKNFVKFFSVEKAE